MVCINKLLPFSESNQHISIGLLMGNVSFYLREMGTAQPLSLTKFLQHITRNNTRCRSNRSPITTQCPSHTRAVRLLLHPVRRHRSLPLDFLHYHHRCLHRLRLGSSEGQSHHHLYSRQHPVLTTKTWGSEVRLLQIKSLRPSRLRPPRPVKSRKRRGRRRRGELR